MTGDGTGTYDNRSTAAATDGSYTDVFASHVNFTWNLVFKGTSFTPGAENGLNAPRSLAGQASASVTYSDTPEQNASCAGPVNDTGTDGSPSMSFAEFPQDGATKALDFTVQLMGGSNLTWPSTCDSSWATFPDSRPAPGRRAHARRRRCARRNLRAGRRPWARHARQPFSYPVDDFAPPVVKQATPHQGSAGTTAR